MKRFFFFSLNPNHLSGLSLEMCEFGFRRQSEITELKEFISDTDAGMVSPPLVAWMVNIAPCGKLWQETASCLLRSRAEHTYQLWAMFSVNKADVDH